MNIFSKDVLLDVAYIGAGSAAASVVTSKVTPKILPDKLKNNKYVEASVPVVLGLLLPSVLGGSRLVRGLGNGMIAYGAGIIVDKALSAAGVTGVGQVMLGNVGSDSVMMGNTDAYGDTFSSSSYDISSADAGELDF